MIIVGEITQCEPWKDNDKRFNVSIEGLSLVPSDDLPNLPKRGQMVKATVKTIWAEDKKNNGRRRPLYFLNHWAEVQFS